MYHSVSYAHWGICRNLKPIIFLFRLDSFNFCLKFVFSFIKKFAINILSSNKYFDIYIRKFNPVCTYCATSRYSRMGVAHRHFSSKEKNLGRNSRSSTSSHVILHTKLYNYTKYYKYLVVYVLTHNTRFVLHYGNTGCGVFKRGYKIRKIFT